MKEEVKFTNSSRLLEASYEPHSGAGEAEKGTLTVMFNDRNHSRYAYRDVARIDWVRLCLCEQTGESAGRVFENYIKGHDYAYIKL